MIQNDMIVAALLQTRSVREAAEFLHIGESTVYRALRKPEVRAALDEARRDLLRTTLLAMHGLLGKALEAVDHCLDEDQPSSVQLSAARLLIESVLKAADVLDVDARLAALEAQAQNQPEGMPFEYERKQS